MTRYCDCGRELEFHCHVCSECRQINIDIAIDKRNASRAQGARALKYYHEVYKYKYPSFKKIREESESQWQK